LKLKNLVLAEVILILFVGDVLAQCPTYTPFEIPYYEGFEETSFHSNEFSLGGVARQGTFVAGQDQYCTQSTISDVSSAEGYSWDISSDYQTNDSCGNALKLTVHKHDHPQMARDSNCHSDKSRAETFVHLSNDAETTRFYSWRMYIPTDFEDVGTLEDLMAQIMVESCTETGASDPLGGRKTLGMAYRHDDTANPSENLRDLRFYLYNADDSSQDYVKKIKVTDGLEKGVWNEFLMEITWSATSNNNGDIKIWINRAPIKLDPNQSPNPTNQDVVYHCILGSISDPVESFEFSNIAFDENDNPSKSVMKFGHYRGNAWSEEYCGTTLPMDDMTIECYELSNVGQYKFRFTDNPGTSATYFYINSTSTTLDLCGNSNFEPGTTYTVDVRTVGILDSSSNPCFSYGYGQACEITIPSITRIKESFCGENVILKNCHVLVGYCLAGASTYDFRFTNVTDNTTEVLSRTSPEILLDDASILGTGDEIEVDVKVPPSTTYGDVCSFEMSTYACPNRRLSSETMEEGNLSPNPFHSRIDLSGFDYPLTSYVFDVSGKLVAEEFIQTDGNSLNLSRLETGTYFIKIQSPSQSVIRKMVKN
jgi:hypothetical protein